MVIKWWWQNVDSLITLISLSITNVICKWRREFWKLIFTSQNEAFGKLWCKHANKPHTMPSYCVWKFTRWMSDDSKIHELMRVCVFKWKQKWSFVYACVCEKRHFQIDILDSLSVSNSKRHNLCMCVYENLIYVSFSHRLHVSIISLFQIDQIWSDVLWCEEIFILWCLCVWVRVIKFTPKEEGNNNQQTWLFNFYSGLMALVFSVSQKKILEIYTECCPYFLAMIRDTFIMCFKKKAWRTFREQSSQIFGYFWGNWKSFTFCSVKAWTFVLELLGIHLGIVCVCKRSENDLFSFQWLLLSSGFLETYSYFKKI
jgi:hypothetical protein